MADIDFTKPIQLKKPAKHGDRVTFEDYSGNMSLIEQYLNAYIKAGFTILDTTRFIDFYKLKIKDVQTATGADAVIPTEAYVQKLVKDSIIAPHKQILGTVSLAGKDSVDAFIASFNAGNDVNLDSGLRLTHQYAQVGDVVYARISATGVTEELIIAPDASKADGKALIYLTNFSPLLADFDTAKSNIATLRTDTNTLRTDVNTLSSDKANKTDVYAKTETYSKTEVDALKPLINDKVATATFTSAVSSLQTAVNGKASQADLTSLETKVNGKADTATVTTLQTAVTSLGTDKVSTTDFDALKIAVGTKADSASVYAKTDTYSKAEVDASQAAQDAKITRASSDVAQVASSIENIGQSISDNQAAIASVKAQSDLDHQDLATVKTTLTGTTTKAQQAYDLGQDWNTEKTHLVRRDELKTAATILGNGRRFTRVGTSGDVYECALNTVFNGNPALDFSTITGHPKAIAGITRTLTVDGIQIVRTNSLADPSWNDPSAEGTDTVYLASDLTSTDKTSNVATVKITPEKITVEFTNGLNAGQRTVFLEYGLAGIEFIDAGASQVQTQDTYARQLATQAVQAAGAVQALANTKQDALTSAQLEVLAGEKYIKTSVFNHNSDLLVSNYSGSGFEDAYIGKGYLGSQYYGEGATGKQYYGQEATGAQFYGAGSTGNLIIGSESALAANRERKLVSGNKEATFEQIIDKAKEPAFNASTLFTQNADKLVSNDTLTATNAYLGHTYKGDICLGENMLGNLYLGKGVTNTIYIGQGSGGGIEIGSAASVAPGRSRKLMDGSHEATFRQIIDKAKEPAFDASTAFTNNADKLISNNAGASGDQAQIGRAFAGNQFYGYLANNIVVGSGVKGTAQFGCANQAPATVEIGTDGSAPITFGTGSTSNITIGSTQTTGVRKLVSGALEATFDQIITAALAPAISAADKASWDGKPDTTTVMRLINDAITAALNKEIHITFADGTTATVKLNG